MSPATTVDEQAVLVAVSDFLADNDPRTLTETEFLGRRFDAGLAWIHFPTGSGGLDAPRSLQGIVERANSGNRCRTATPGDGGSTLQGGLPDRCSHSGFDAHQRSR